MVIKRFEDIQAWQEARALRKLVYAATRTPVFGRDGRLCGQIESAAVSVMANIAEGFDGGTDIEFARFLQIAFRSATEVQSHSYAALDEHYLTQEQFDTIYNQAFKTKNLIKGFRQYLLSSNKIRKSSGRNKPNT